MKEVPESELDFIKDRYKKSLLIVLNVCDFVVICHSSNRKLI